MAENGDTANNAQPSSPKLYFIKEARAKSVPQQLTGNHDLMTTFNLLPLYNRYVKQKLENNEDVPPIEPTYFPFISDLPGKNAIKPGTYIRALLEAPEKTYGPIHPFAYSTIRDGFSLRPGQVPGFDSSVLGTEEDMAAKNNLKIPTIRGPPSGETHSSTNNMGYSEPSSAMVSGTPVHSGQSQHHHPHHLNHGSSSTSSPYVDKTERGDGDVSREHKHKKKKKKRKHEHDHEHSHHDGEGDSEHRKKKKRKKEREEHGEYGEHGELDIM